MHEARPLELLYKAALADLTPYGRALREQGWPAELQVDVDGESYVISLRIRVGPNMPVPVEARPERAMPIRSGQSAAYHAKCNDLADAKGQDREQAKADALAWASDAFGRTIATSKELSADEASELLDWLTDRITEERATKG